MTVVSARYCDRHGPRGALLFMTHATSHSPRHVMQLGIPAADFRQEIRRGLAFVQTAFALEKQHVLAELVGQLFDFEVLRHFDTVHTSSNEQKTVFAGPIGRPECNVLLLTVINS